MAITVTYINYAIPAGTNIINRPAGAYLRFMCEAEADLPTANVVDGDMAFTEDVDRRWLRVGGAWVLQTNDVIAAALVSTSQTAALPIGAWTDGQYLKRVGAEIVGAAVSGSVAWDDVTGKPTTFAPIIGAGGGDAVAGNDTRLTNARTPTAHAASHVTGGSDVIANAVAAGNAGLLTGADKTKLDAQSGTNTGDQTSIVGITGTLAQFNTALTGADFTTGGGTASGTNTGDQTTVSGNAGTATALQTARTINGVSFDGTGNITVTAAAETLTGSALPALSGAALTGLTKSQVGLGNADNTSDANKPVSTATQTALDAKQATLVSGTTIKTINGSSVLGAGDLSVSASDPSYTPGSFTVADGTGRLVIKRLQLTTTQRATLAGTARLKVA